MGVRFNSQIGSRRIGSTFSDERADSTRSARAEMASIIQNYRRFVKHVEDVTPELLLEALQPTYDKSQVYVPKDTGRLSESGYLEIIEFRGTPTVEIGYGLGGEPPYAAEVHENMEWNHKEPTRAKWLQAAIAEDAQEIQARIIQGFSRVVG